MARWATLCFSVTSSFPLQMHLSKHVRHILWFGLPFVLVLALQVGTIHLNILTVSGRAIFQSQPASQQTAFWKSGQVLVQAIFLGGRVFLVF